MATSVTNGDAKKDRVVEAVMLKQGDTNDPQFAKKLGISRVMWRYLRLGERNPGLTFYLHVVEVFPELATLCITVITERITPKTNKLN